MSFSRGSFFKKFSVSCWDLAWGVEWNTNGKLDIRTKGIVDKCSDLKCTKKYALAEGPKLGGGVKVGQSLPPPTPPVSLCLLRAWSWIALCTTDRTTWFQMKAEMQRLSSDRLWEKVSGEVCFFFSNFLILSLIVDSFTADFVSVLYNWKIKRDLPVSWSLIEILSHDIRRQEITCSPSQGWRPRRPWGWTSVNDDFYLTPGY